MPVVNYMDQNLVTIFTFIRKLVDCVVFLNVVDAVCVCCGNAMFD